MSYFKNGQLVAVDGKNNVLWDSWDGESEEDMLEIADLQDGELCIVIKDGFVNRGYHGVLILRSTGVSGYTYRVSLKSQ